MSHFRMEQFRKQIRDILDEPQTPAPSLVERILKKTKVKLPKVPKLPKV